MTKKKPAAKKPTRSPKPNAAQIGTVPESVSVPDTEAVHASVEKILASTDAAVVNSDQSLNATQKPVVDPDNPNRKDRIMTLTYKGLSKSGKFALYAGLRTVTRLSITDFPDQKPIPSFEVQGDFAGPRQKMTAEERKAARKNAPKPTLAELIAKREKALAALKAKAATQPEGEAVAAM